MADLTDMVSDAGSPAVTASGRRNVQGTLDRARRRRWRPAREAARLVLQPHVSDGIRAAVIGCGNGDTVPLRDLARQSAQLDLIDVDGPAMRRARRHCRPWARRLQLHEVDVSAGAVDLVVAAALEHREAKIDVIADPLGDPPYDLVVVDLMLSQVLHPALVDAGVSEAQHDAALHAHGQALTDAIVARVHASAPAGTIVVLHDLLGWWAGHPQPVTLAEILAARIYGLDSALRVAARGVAPIGPRRGVVSCSVVLILALQAGFSGLVTVTDAVTGLVTGPLRHKRRARRTPNACA